MQFLDYKAALSIGMTMTIVPWVRNVVAIGILSCILDVSEFSISVANAISAEIIDLAGILSKIILAAMRNIIMKRLYQAAGLLSLVILYTIYG